MHLGILSDTHGHCERTVEAVTALLTLGADTFIHCGDIGSEQVLFEIAALTLPKKLPVYAVLGNVDLYNTPLLHFPEESGILVRRRVNVTLGESRCAIIHGDDPRTLSSAIDSGNFDYVFTGHTHTPADNRNGSTRVINPGAIYRATEPGAALLDLSTGILQRVLLG